MNMKQITFIGVVFLLLITGCQTTPSASTAPSTPPVINGNNSDSDPAAMQLAEAASSISQSLTDLKAIAKASAPPINHKKMPYPTSTDMMELASVDWSGPIEPLLHRVARMCDYKFHILGARPAIPVLVTVVAKNTPIGYIIRDANFQAGTRASVFVYPGIRTIELRYGKA